MIQFNSLFHGAKLLKFTKFDILIIKISYFIVLMALDIYRRDITCDRLSDKIEFVQRRLTKYDDR